MTLRAAGWVCTTAIVGLTPTGCRGVASDSDTGVPEVLGDTDTDAEVDDSDTAEVDDSDTTTHSDTETDPTDTANPDCIVTEIAPFVSHVRDAASGWIEGQERTAAFGLGQGMLPMDAADLSGSGNPSLAVGFPGSSVNLERGGAVYVFEAAPGAGDLVASASARILGSEGSLLGQSIAAGDDVTGDGTQDLLVGAPGCPASDCGGDAYVFTGPVVGNLDPVLDATATLHGYIGTDDPSWPDNSYVGEAVAILGDVNGDGYNDVAVSGTGWMRTRGAVYLLHGPTMGELDLATSSAATVIGEPSDYLGTAVRAGGDIDGDGLADMLVGGAGVSMLFSGPVSGSLSTSDATAVFAGTFAPAGLGDENGDGYDDVAATESAPEDGTGSVYVFDGPLAGAIDVTREANARIQGDGPLAYPTDAGDVDGDAARDLAFVGLDPGTEVWTVYLVFGPVSGSCEVAKAAGAALSGDPEDLLGATLTGAVDLDVDGLDDLLIGAPGVEPSGDLWYAGRAYFVPGSALR